MSIDYTLFTFSCVPYSGEDWFTEAAQCAGLGYKSLHQAHPPFQARKTQDEIRVSLVRHPCDWLEQVYVAHQHGSLNGYAGRFGLLRTESFPLFIYHYLDMIPGTIERESDRERTAYFRSVVTIKSQLTGIFYPLVRPGNVVSPGQPLAEIKDLKGDRIGEALSTAEGIVLTILTKRFVNSGDSLFYLLSGEMKA